MDATDVTNAEFANFVAATEYKTVAERPVDWEEIKKQVPPTNRAGEAATCRCAEHSHRADQAVAGGSWLTSCVGGWINRRGVVGGGGWINRRVGGKGGWINRW